MSVELKGPPENLIMLTEESLQPYHNVSVLNSSFPPSTPDHQQTETASAYLLPSFKYVPYLSRVSSDALQALVKGYLLPEKLHRMHDGLSQEQRDRLIRQKVYQDLLHGVRDVKQVLILICGHGRRDMRCGLMGPVLQREFETQLPGVGIQVLHGPVTDEEPSSTTTEASSPLTARVGQISHIGGHKFAGNVIIYIPPNMNLGGTGKAHPLAGNGIWYGRVEPKHVEGLIKETILNGNIVADKFRGGVTSDRQVLRIDGPKKKAEAETK
jgi:hypothetical protein